MAYGFETTAEQVTEGLDLRGRTYLVTGCSSGLGYETTRVLGLRGARVIGVARTAQKAASALQELGVAGDAVACDLSDLRSVASAVVAIRALPPLDGIIANAGIMALPELQQVRGYEAQFFTNHIGHFALITPLLDRLTADGRVVVLSSGAHRMAPPEGIDLDNLSGAPGYQPWAAYGRSKLANILFARALARRLPAGQTANSVHPGVIETNLARHIEDRDAMFARMRNIMKSVGQGAATQVYVATHPEVAQVTGQYFSDVAVAETLHPHAEDDALAEALWARSEAIVANPGP